MARLLRIFIFLNLLQACSSRSQSSPEALYETTMFKQYWYSGRAEISSYRLDQSRYGEQRDGKAVLIFVTEDFSPKTHVKLDITPSRDQDKVSVLKLNFTKNFVTGIYPYSMMLSVFSPIRRDQYPHSMKAAMSSQEWCGQVYSQVDLRGGHFVFRGHSYFEREAEENYSLKASWLEDELWNVIRLNPQNLPTGEIELIPGLFFTRLNHTGVHVMNVLAGQEEHENELWYTVRQRDGKRELTIRYQKEFPHRILGWEESFMERGKRQQTRAVLDKTIVTDYWAKNGNAFLNLRDSLGLSRHNF